MASIGKWQWYDYAELASTNDEALRLCSADNHNFVVITAERQTNGRGRRGRSWIGLDGNLFMSQILPWPQQEYGFLCMITSLAILQAICRFCPAADVKLKWPNDVLLCGKKVSGILLEIGANQKTVCGVGINIAAAPQNADILYPTTSLRDCGIDCNRTEFMKRYLQQFDLLCSDYAEKGGEFISELWQKFAHHQGELLTVRTPQKEISGLYRGLDANGFLLLQTADKKIITIGAGDVFTAQRKED